MNKVLLDRAPHARPGDAQPRERQGRHAVQHRHERVHRPGQGEGRVPQHRHLGPARPDVRRVPRQGPAGRRSRAGSRPGAGTTTAARATGRPRSSPTTSRCCRAGGRRTTRPSPRPTGSRPRPRPTARRPRTTRTRRSPPRPSRSSTRRSSRGLTSRRRTARPARRTGGGSPSRRRSASSAGASSPWTSSAAGRCRSRPSGELEERRREDQVDDHEERALEPVRLAVEGDERADPDRGDDRGDLERREDEVHRVAGQRRRGGRGPAPRTGRPGGSRRRPRPSRTPSGSCTRAGPRRAARRGCRSPAGSRRRRRTSSARACRRPARSRRRGSRRGSRAGRPPPTRTTAASRPVQRTPSWSPRGSWPPSVVGRVRELVDQRQDVAGDQEDRDEDRVLDRRCPALVDVLKASTAGMSSPIAARTRSAAFEPAISRLKVWRPFRSPPTSTLSAEDEQQVADDRAGQATP